MRILVIIPAYNEEGNIVRVVDNLITNYPQYDYVVVNDGSRDATVELCRQHHYHLLNQKVNLGLAGTFQTGMKYALKHGYDAAIQFDGDGQHRPEYIQAMAEEIARGADIVIGSRFVTEKKPRTMRMLGSNVIQGFIHLVTRKTIHDPTSGMRMYGPRVIYAMAELVNMPPEPDTIAYLLRCGADVREVQVSMDERTAGVSYLNPFRSVEYMVSVCLSILFYLWFRPKIRLEMPREDSTYDDI